MESDGLRLVLLLVGVAVVAGVYFYTRNRPPGAGAGPERRRADPRVPPLEDSETELDPPGALADERVLVQEERIPTLYDEIFPEPKPGEPSDIVAVNVFAEPDGIFEGESLAGALAETGMEYGSMRIYHRSAGTGERMFSLVNCVEPGYFESDDLAGFSTPGLTLFLALPGPQRPLFALDEMILTAQRLAERLAGRLLDSDRNPLRPQGIEHLRQRVAEFERQWRVAQHRK